MLKNLVCKVPSLRNTLGLYYRDVESESLGIAVIYADRSDLGHWQFKSGTVTLLYNLVCIINIRSNHYLFLREGMYDSYNIYIYACILKWCTLMKWGTNIHNNDFTPSKNYRVSVTWGLITFQELIFSTSASNKNWKQ